MVAVREDDDRVSRPGAAAATIPAAGAARGRWTGERIARLAWLAGQGWTAKAIAADPIVRTSEANVYRQAQRFGIALSDAHRGQVVLRRLPAATLAAYDKAAARAGQTRDLFIRCVVIAAADAGLAA